MTDKLATSRQDLEGSSKRVCLCCINSIILRLFDKAPYLKIDIRDINFKLRLINERS